MTSSAADAGNLETEAPLTAASGWRSALPVPDQPIDAWLDLMEVVEALCPAWPAAPRARGENYRL